MVTTSVQPAAAPPSTPWGAHPGQRTIWPTQLQEDLLRATLLEDERALAAWQRIRPTLEPGTLEHSTQALLPELRRNLTRLGCEDRLLELFKGVHRFAWARNQLLLAEVMPVVASLERAGVPTLMLKGAALMSDDRRDAGVRLMSDIDVLVPFGSLAAACRVLDRLGMAPVEQVPLWYVIDYAPRFKHSCNFRNAAGGQLDLHWHALKWSCHPAADAEFWAGSEAIRLRGVQTRALCPADEILLVILHGLRWSPTPSYRWVLDAALIARGGQAVDYDRLVEQARCHRVTHATRVGLLYLRRIAQIEVPPDALRALQVLAPLQRLELRSQATRPRSRHRAAQAVSLHVQHVRRKIAPGTRAGPLAQLRLAWHQLGTGPERPFAEHAAPIGSGTCVPPPLRWDTALEFGDPNTVREHCRYGMWLPSNGVCWIAGPEARLALTLPEPAYSSILLQLVAAGFTETRARQRLQVMLDQQPVGKLHFDQARPRVDLENIVLPARLVRGRSRLEIGLRAPDAISPAQLGIADDERRLGVFVVQLRLRTPRHCTLGEWLELGRGTADGLIVAGGWGEAEPGGRWTEGSVARLLMTSSATPSLLEWHADPLIAAGATRLRVEVRANGVKLGVVDYRDAGPRVRLGLGKAARRGELLLSWHIREPRSPRDLGLSEDARQLGLFFQKVRLL